MVLRKIAVGLVKLSIDRSEKAIDFRVQYYNSSVQYIKSENESKSEKRLNKLVYHKLVILTIV